MINPTNIMTRIVLPALWPVAPVPRWWVAGTGSPVDWPTRVGRWLTDVPGLAARLGHLVAVLWWPWLPLVVLLVLAVTVAVRVAWRAAWRRVVAGGYWLAITPPRTLDAARFAKLWPSLHPLTKTATGGRWVIRPPVAFEVYGDGQRLRAGLWLPGWVPLDDAASAVGRAWPGAAVERRTPPAVDVDGGAVAGVRLVADALHPDTGWLVNDARPRTGARRGGGDDPDLAGVFASLGQADGPVLLQVLVRPATGRRLAHLAAAGRRPVPPRRHGGAAGVQVLLWVLNLAPRLLVVVFDFLTTKGPPRPSRSTRPEPPDAMAREAMAEARAKRATGPHLLATIRVGAAAGRRGDARQAARSVAYGYAETSRALHPVRLHGPAELLGQRRARRGDWLLVTATELGVLAHLPPDPALYGLQTAALHRTPPTGTPRATPERRGPRRAGWNRTRWTDPTGTPTAAHEGTNDRADHDNPDHNDAAGRNPHHDGAPELPAPRSTPYRAHNDQEDEPDDWTDDEDDEGL